MSFEFSLVWCIRHSIYCTNTIQNANQLSGMGAKKALQNFPKESKVALRVSKGAKGGQFPYENDVVPQTLDIVLIDWRVNRRGSNK